MDRTYRCLTCLEHTLSREFDTSHLSVRCPVCSSFERFVNEAVFEQFRAFEESPPESLEWSTLDRGERLMISEAVTRRGRSVEDFSVEH
ncbi:MAG: DNA-directed RNA polymerase subunit RPC12/RpoP [Natronomonas sp.]|jgi:DNA-directed RNA polymerase subunit RPC12/RpoP|uniref:hypothetical protein n=1 Tax=Natronomonas sp. TaxID=2184060 RepID=UPI003989D11A